MYYDNRMPKKALEMFVPAAASPCMTATTSTKNDETRMTRMMRRIALAATEAPGQGKH